MLRNALPVTLREEVAPARSVNRALGMVVLALLHLEGGKMEEGVYKPANISQVLGLNLACCFTPSCNFTLTHR